jgi:hypothetical protein
MYRLAGLPETKTLESRAGGPFYMVIEGLCPFEISWCFLASDSSVSANCGFVEGGTAIALQERLSSRTSETGMIHQSCNAHIAFKIRRMHNHVEKKKSMILSTTYFWLSWSIQPYTLLEHL